MTRSRSSLSSPLFSNQNKWIKDKSRCRSRFSFVF
jgi:hypothetical protein